MRAIEVVVSCNTHDQELFGFHRDHSPCDGFEEVLNCYNVFAQLLRRQSVSLIRDVSKKVFSKMGTSIGYEIGTMIEIPRAALVADEVHLIDTLFAISDA
ncbi:hypothetical protein Syun_003446 [Stephania yunnanensis]|uniref:PEP-utilising enzyme C-terminal domain-containing protein n=1 Tax=Stephania yunnanensis TaxID=152371 RepID=A0AAP0L392_9MAGN